MAKIDSELGRFISHWQVRIPVGADVASDDDFRRYVSGLAIGNGVYSLFPKTEHEKWRRLIGELFPRFGNRVEPVGHDWLGRLFVLDQTGGEDDGCTLLLAPCTGDRFVIPAGFREFHGCVLVDQIEEALDAAAFAAWSKENGPLTANQCVGFKTPLVLGGKANPSNYEVADVEIYWALLSQITLQVRGPWY
jgi:hypothetical protein